MALPEELRQWRRAAPAGRFAEVDFHFADLIGRLDPTAGLPLLQAALLVSAASARGDVCVPLAGLGGRAMYAGEAAPTLPALAPWRQALRRSALVGAAGDYAPLILDDADRLYLRRYWCYEQSVAVGLRQRAAHEPDDVDEQVLAADLATVGGDGGEAVDWQRIAVAVAVLRGLCVISGGPGTGKTTTIVRLLRVLRRQAEARGMPAPRIALAAPTGKAAHRLQEAVRAGSADPDGEPGAQTVHRLLGVRPDSVYFRYDRNNPLPLDVLIVDEASMVDVAMMSKLLAAVPDEARLVLLGDRDQLASVQAGAVLGDICHGPTDFSEPMRARIAALGLSLPAGTGAPAQTSPLADSIVTLERSWRFAGDSGIGAFAAAVKDQDGDSAMALLSTSSADRGYLPLDTPAGAEAIVQQAVRAYGPCLRARDAGAPPAEVLAAFERFRILCPHRGGALGVDWLAEQLELALAREGLIDRHAQWYPGKPIMINRNNHELGLYNGDIGITLAAPDAGGALRVFFRGQSGELRAFVPERLPAHESAWAITVHKSQGSEYDEVLLVLPGAVSELISRELIYTAVTRARRRVTVATTPAVLRVGLERRVERASGLRDALDAAGSAGN